MNSLAAPHAVLDQDISIIWRRSGHQALVIKVWIQFSVIQMVQFYQFMMHYFSK